MGEPILAQRIDFTIFSFTWSLFLRIWNEQGNILAAEFDANKRSSIQYISQFLRKSYPLIPTSPYAYERLTNTIFFGKLCVCIKWMIPTCDGFKVCYLKKMLLSPIFGFDTLNFTKGKFTGYELGVYYKKHSRTKSLLPRKITLNKFFIFRELLRTTFLHSTSVTAYEAKEIYTFILQQVYFGVLVEKMIL